jgi:hypothetical protein
MMRSFADEASKLARHAHETQMCFDQSNSLLTGKITGNISQNPTHPFNESLATGRFTKTNNDGNPTATTDIYRKARRQSKVPQIRRGQWA